MPKDYIQPKELFPSAQMGFTQVVASPPGKQLFISGQVSCDQSGRPVAEGDLAAQAEQALANLGHALAAAGASAADVTATRVYIVNMQDQNLGAIGPPFAKFYDGVKPAASTWIGVTALAGPQFMIEIEATAVVES